MNIRNLYLVIVVFSALGLLYEWNSEQKTKSRKNNNNQIKISNIHFKSSSPEKFFIAEAISSDAFLYDNSP